MGTSVSSYGTRRQGSDDGHNRHCDIWASHFATVQTPKQGFSTSSIMNSNGNHGKSPVTGAATPGFGFRSRLAVLLGPAFWECHLHTIPVAWAEAGLLDVLLGRKWLCSTEFLVNVRTQTHIFLSFGSFGHTVLVAAWWPGGYSPTLRGSVAPWLRGWTGSVERVEPVQRCGRSSPRCASGNPPMLPGGCTLAQAMPRRCAKI